VKWRAGLRQIDRAEAVVAGFVAAGLDVKQDANDGDDESDGQDDATQPA
jgi:hypothetical protein